MSRRPREDSRDPLASTRTERTLRDILHELPVDALVPDGWRVGTEVVTFGDGLPEDGVTLRHVRYPRDLLLTPAGADADAGDALVLYERDRTAGRRRAVASVTGGGDPTAELEAGLQVAARAAEHVEGGGEGEAAVDSREPSHSLSETVDGDEKRVNFY